MSSPGNEGWFESQEREFWEDQSRKRSEVAAFACTPEGRAIAEQRQREESELYWRLNAELQEIETEDQGEPFDTEAEKTTGRHD